MKQLFTIILACIFATNLFAQTDTTKVDIVNKNVVTIIEGDDKVQVTLGKGQGVEVITDDWGDTTHVRVGRRIFKVIEGDNGTYVKYEKDEKRKKWGGRFNAHWSGLEFGPNIMTNTDYSMYNDDYPGTGEFMELNPGKSLTWNLNIAEYAFTNEHNTFGLVTGLGFSFQDYTFDNRNFTIEKENGTGNIVPKLIQPNPDENNNPVKKTKLHVNYITAPLMLEVKTPLRMGSSRLYLAGGVIGSLYLGSHTKYKYKDGDKFKEHSSYNINKWKYELTGRIGFGDFCVFANYSMTKLFKDGKGPGVQPLMIGISFPNI